MSNLRELYLGSNQLAVLAELRTLPKLTHLDLSFNKLTDFDQLKGLTV